MNKSIYFALLAMLVFSGCGDGTQQTTILTEKDISLKSAKSYDDNSYGVIGTTVLAGWLDDWQANKPAKTEGRLIVLQAGATSFDNNATQYLKHNDTDVLVYGIPAGGACDPSYMRFDGISNTPGAMVSGERIDGNINFFQLDPNKDFIVFAVGAGSTSIREIIRTWWSLVYWGWDMERLAFLDGSVSYNFSPNSGKQNYLVANPSPMPEQTKEYHMSDAKTDRTALHLYIDEMKEIAKKEDKTGYFIADARGTSEYEGTKKSATASMVCGPDNNTSCYSAFRGHIKGAVDFPYTDILIMDDGIEDLNGDGIIDKNDASFKFKSHDDLVTLYANKGYREGDTVIAYCRTGRKSTLLALTSVAVLGYPIRMYDGSWMQWGSMASTEDINGTLILDTNSTQRVDLEIYSTILGYNDPIDVEPSTTYKIDLNTRTSQKIKEEDKAYLLK